VATSSGKEQLLQVGLTRFLADGYAATGINTILEQAGVPKGSFYHHFASKEAFAVEVLKLYASGEDARFAEHASSKKRPPLARLQAYFKAMIAAHGHGAEVSGCLLGGLSAEVCEHSDLVRNATRGALDSWQAAIAELLQAAVKEGQLPKSSDVNELAALIVAHWQGALLRMKAEQSNRPLELFLRFTFGTLLKS
jgi:TetR/AcrR family transcriptional repressor of nem operon